MEIIRTSLYLQIIVSAYNKIIYHPTYFGLPIYKIRIK